MTAATRLEIRTELTQFLLLVHWSVKRQMVCFYVQSICRLLSRPYFGNISDLFACIQGLHEFRTCDDEQPLN